MAGVDGYKGGWVILLADAFPPTDLEVYTCEDFHGVLHRTEECSVVMVDMPIGIPSGSAVRGCDIEARNLLGQRGSSRLFFTPPRESLEATTPEEFQRIHRELRARGAGIPVWGIFPKLREVDEAMKPKHQEKVREYHPELAWMRLAGRVLPSKHGACGLVARLEYLICSNVFEKIVEITRALPDSLQMDDFLDAYVGLKVAHDFLDKSAKCVRSDPPSKDAHGLRMEIWY